MGARDTNQEICGCHSLPKSACFCNSPAHVAAAWIGHSVEIANKHYWQVTDDDFARAVGKTKAAQNPAQQVHAGPRRGSQVTGSAYKETTALQGSASSRETLQTSRVGDRGLEPTTKTSGKSRFISTGSAKSSAPGVNESVIEVPTDIDLRTIIDSWPFLSPSVRSKIMDLVRAEER